MFALKLEVDNYTREKELGIEYVSDSNLKYVSWTILYVHKIYFLLKREKPMKYGVVVIFIFRFPP